MMSQNQKVEAQKIVIECLFKLSALGIDEFVWAESYNNLRLGVQLGPDQKATPKGEEAPTALGALEALVRARQGWMAAGNPEPVRADVSPDFARRLKKEFAERPIYNTDQPGALLTPWYYILGMQIHIELQPIPVRIVA